MTVSLYYIKQRRGRRYTAPRVLTLDQTELSCHLQSCAILIEWQHTKSTTKWRRGGGVV